MEQIGRERLGERGRDRREKRIEKDKKGMIERESEMRRQRAESEIRDRREERQEGDERKRE